MLLSVYVTVDKPPCLSFSYVLLNRLSAHIGVGAESHWHTKCMLANETIPMHRNTPALNRLP